jgi:transposase-like protein
LQGKELLVAKKRAIGRYPKAFRKMAVERLKSCENIVALSEELGVHRRLLYKWLPEGEFA